MPDTGARKKWVFKWKTHLLREADITVDQAERIEELTGTSWLFINPLRTAKHARAVVSVMGADAEGRTQIEVAAEVGAMSVESFLDLLDVEDDDTPSVYEDGNPPQAAATSTDTSSTS
jgi:hypothetical protein